MIVYLDTSNLVKLYIDEPGADEIQQLVARAEAVATSVVAYAEVRATFARRRREQLMTRGECQRAISQLDADWPRFVVLPLDDARGQLAGRLADRHGLRGCDAVHLAAFDDLVARSDNRDVFFSCADDGLTRAAQGLKCT